jgi:hypothetical protein
VQRETRKIGIAPGIIVQFYAEHDVSMIEKRSGLL